MKEKLKSGVSECKVDWMIWGFFLKDGIRGPVSRVKNLAIVWCAILGPSIILSFPIAIRGHKWCRRIWRDYWCDNFYGLTTMYVPKILVIQSSIITINDQLSHLEIARPDCHKSLLRHWSEETVCSSVQKLNTFIEAVYDNAVYFIGHTRGEGLETSISMEVVEKPVISTSPSLSEFRPGTWRSRGTIGFSDS